MGRIEENKQDKQERLLNTAFQLFSTQGIAKTSIADIADKAGVAKGTFYLYFKDKYHLADRLIVHKGHILGQQALSSLEKTTLTDPIDRMLFMIDAILGEFERNPSFLRFINKNLTWGLFEHAIRNESDDVKRMVNTVFLDSLNRWHDLNTMLYIILELVGSSCYSVILDRDPMGPEEFRPHLHNAVRGIMNSFRV